jgi:hypothetical protein
MSTREPERLLTIAQAGATASYDEATILQWIARGLPHIAPGGRRRPRHADIRIKSSALWAWLDSLTLERRPPAEPPRAQAQAKANAKMKPNANAQFPRRPSGTSSLSAWRDAK